MYNSSESHMVVLFFRFCCVLYVALLESLVVRVLRVLFLFIYFLTCFQSVNKKKKRQCLKIIDFFLGIIYIILTLY